jgi:hypothetical protein
MFTKDQLQAVHLNIIIGLSKKTFKINAMFSQKN